MKVIVNDKELFTLTEVQKKVIANDIPKEKLEEDMKRRMFHIINHKYEQCFKRLKAKWEPILHARDLATPPKKDDFAELVFSQPDYKDRSAREAEEIKI